MNRWQRDVRAFHRRFGFPAPDGVTMLSRPQADQRERLIREEFRELYETFGDCAPHRMAGELVDLIYVCLGTAVAMGLDLEPHWREVQRKNMQKVKVPGKWKAQKPEGFEPPDHLGVLLRGLEREDRWNKWRLRAVLVGAFVVGWSMWRYFL